MTLTRSQDRRRRIESALHVIRQHDDVSGRCDRCRPDPPFTNGCERRLEALSEHKRLLDEEDEETRRRW